MVVKLALANVLLSVPVKKLKIVQYLAKIWTRALGVAFYSPRRPTRFAHQRVLADVLKAPFIATQLNSTQLPVVDPPTARLRF